MRPSDVLCIALAEQERALSIVSGLSRCPVELSRATTQLGSFEIDRRTGATRIRISRHLIDEAQVRDTARHELAHQAAWELHGHLGHGPLWQTWALYLDCKPKACGSGIDAGVAAARQRYAITCARCGWTTTRQKRSKLVTRTRRFGCAECRGPLRVLDLRA